MELTIECHIDNIVTHWKDCHRIKYLLHYQTEQEMVRENFEKYNKTVIPSSGECYHEKVYSQYVCKSDKPLDPMFHAVPEEVSKNNHGQANAVNERFRYAKHGGNQELSHCLELKKHMMKPSEASMSHSRGLLAHTYWKPTVLHLLPLCVWAYFIFLWFLN